MVAGRYRLQSVLGSGSMGTVWSAYDEFLHRPVAVKEVRLPPGVPPSRAAELRERTLREARAIAVLSHPNVIILHDVARENDEPFVVMELLPGRSLAGLLRGHGPLTPPQAAAVADAVGSALEAAHTAGITHRDVKPGNVLVARDGRIKLNDFGIARNVSEATMTRTGMMLGSPAYIAPEVASGGAVTPAADLWGLGATLFAAVLGRPPYDANGDPLETVNRVVHGEVPEPGPGPLAPVIRGLMAKEPGARMPLREVRRRLYPLLAQPRHTLFGPELFADTPASTAPDRADTTATQVITAPVSPGPPLPDQEKAGAGGELAADPGPLPFATPSGPVGQEPVGTPAGGRPRRRLPSVAVTVAAVLLFLAAAAGGFVLTRVVAAQPLAPPQRSDAGPAAPPLRELAPRQGDATNLRGARGGLFSVQVPKDWTKFVSRETGGGLPPRTLVQFVSADGTQSFDVARFESEPPLSPTAYWNALGKLWGGNLRQVEFTPLTEGRQGVLLSYRTVESSPVRPDEHAERPLNRATVAHVFLAQDSLWVVGLTVPTDQEGTARTQLFDRIMPTFQIME
ncbi:serine/threonine-protein kinase [Amycolatopsis aidingensis]|uniref:serine/threonine-protein kinase n=1 Tax=Amycolatopsis aidingensis TaxID=2842453 RepID=UPI001C0C1E0A|nr:serine/threonine-protein kinase [Amycolatopsis aidingensis]